MLARIGKMVFPGFFFFLFIYLCIYAFIFIFYFVNELTYLIRHKQQPVHIHFNSLTKRKVHMLSSVLLRIANWHQTLEWVSVQSESLSGRTLTQSIYAKANV